MVISFHIKNFRSIIETTLSMTYDEGKAPNGYKTSSCWPFLEEAHHRLVPCLAIYGANAAGKSNIIKAWFAIDRLLKIGPKAAFEPNKLLSNQSTTLFEVTLLVDGVVYIYTIEYTAKEIVLESLKREGKRVFERTQGKVFDASAIASELYSEDRLKEIFRVECSDDEGCQIRSFLWVLGKNYGQLSKDVKVVRDYFLSSVFISLNNAIPETLGMAMLEEALKAGGQTETAFDKLQKIIAKLDFGIQRMEINRERLNQVQEAELQYTASGVPISIRHAPDGDFAEYLYAYHEDDQGKEVRFLFQEESTGTRIAFGVLGSILAALEQGGVVLIDELDRSLHSLVFQQIVRFFKDKRFNTKNAQLVFTAHNTDFLENEHVRVSEIAFVNKTKKQGTTLTRLTEFDNVRNVSNFRKRYLSGEFEAIPFPYI